MEFLVHFALGFAASFIGTLPPGMISLTVVDAAIKQNFRVALNIALAASFVEFFQAFIAIELSGLLAQHPAVASFMQISAIPVFVVMALYFLLKKNKTDAEEKKMNPGSGYRKGVIVAMFNVLVVPFWILWTTYFASNGWMDYEHSTIAMVSLGISFGTLAALFLFGRLGLFIVTRMQSFIAWSNVVIGVIFFILAAYQAYRVWLVN